MLDHRGQCRFGTPIPLIAAVAALSIVPAEAPADALVRTNAMLATTIAEFFVEPEQVIVELEDEAIYDVLQKSVSGDLLEQIYLEVLEEERL